MRTKFINPPINELIVGVYFNAETAGLRAEHVGAFWSSLRGEFPKIQQQIPIAHPITVPATATIELMPSGEPFPMPRFWLESSEPSFLMQIQKDAFLFNWRRRDQQYPHFNDVKKQFDENFARYEGFLKDEFEIALPPVATAELTYTNLIEPCEYWSGPKDTAEVLNNFSITGAPWDDVDSTEFNHVAVQRFASNLSVRTTVRSGKTTKGACLIFELRCTGGQGNVPKAETDQWFDRAHNIVHDTFIGMTNPAVQQEFWIEKKE